MNIKTDYRNDGKGGKIVARTVYEGKRRQISISYPYTLNFTEKHTLAATRLLEKIGIAATLEAVDCKKGGKFTVTIL